MFTGFFVGLGVLIGLEEAAEWIRKADERGVIQAKKYWAKYELWKY